VKDSVSYKKVRKNFMIKEIETIQKHKLEIFMILIKISQHWKKYLVLGIKK